MERRNFTLKWDNEYQYTDGVPAQLVVASPWNLDDNEKVKVVEVKEGDVILTKEQFEQLKFSINVVDHADTLSTMAESGLWLKESQVTEQKLKALEILVGATHALLGR